MRVDRFVSTRQQFLCAAQMLAVPIVLLALSSTASAQIQHAGPGSIEYELINSNQSWIEVPDPIIIGSYVEDTLEGRLNQPDGRGIIGIVTDTAFDAPYDEMAATVDFGRGYTAGIVFSELTAVQIVPEPSTLLLLPGMLFCGAAARRRRREKVRSTL